MLLVRSLVVALLVGPSIGFINFVASVNHPAKYVPPVSATEMDRLR
jgi:hypothetical protein